LLGTLGCTESEPEEIPEVSAHDESATEEEAAEETEAAPVADEAPDEDVERPVAEETGVMAEPTETDDAEPVNEDSPPCEQAYASVIALRDSMIERLGRSASPPPDRTLYLQTCNALPEEAQRCMIIAYSMQHQEECAEHREAIRTARATAAAAN